MILRKKKKKRKEQNSILERETKRRERNDSCILFRHFSDFASFVTSILFEIKLFDSFCLRSSFQFHNVCLLNVVSLIFAQRLLNQKRLRSFDVKFADRRRRFLDCVSLRLILLQWSMINVSWDFYCRRILVLIWNYVKWNLIDYICVSTLRSWLSVKWKTLFIILRFCFCKSMNLLIKIIVVFSSLCNAYYVLFL